jgi:hypothetical protein
MNNIVRISFFYAVYQLVFLWFFDAISFYEAKQSNLIFYGLTFGIIFSFQVAGMFVLDKRKMDPALKGIATSSTFILSAVFSAGICWWVFSGNRSIFLILLSAFVVLSLFPALSTFILNSFRQNESAEKNQVSNVNEEMGEQGTEPEVRFILENEGGKKLLDVNVARIFCFEANDNYVITFYLDKDNRARKSMDRISLKKIEEILETLGVAYFHRVHKSFLVNRNFVQEVKGKAQAQKIVLDSMEYEVPISRSFDVSSLDLNRH